MTSTQKAELKEVALLAGLSFVLAVVLLGGALLILSWLSGTPLTRWAG